jgi:hypothetical protein
LSDFINYCLFNAVFNAFSYNKAGGIFMGQRNCPIGLTTTVGAAAAAISKNLNDDEIAFLSAVFMMLGDSLSLILAQRACAQDEEDGEKNDTNG